jgi:hypothetical protein
MRIGFISLPGAICLLLSFYFSNLLFITFYRYSTLNPACEGNQSMKRRDLLKSAALLPLLPGLHAFADKQSNPKHLWQGYDFGSFFPSEGRLDQGPFDIDQDQGWQTVLFTTPSEKPIRNPGLGLVGYTWEEGGPSVAVREGRQMLEDHVEKMASLPFVDVLYIRCDWRNVQKQAGRLDLDPVWELTMAAAKRHGLRVAFRIQSSNTVFQPQQLALPEFLRSRVPLVKIGPMGKHGGSELSGGAARYWMEPRYDHPEYQKALAELNHLLAARFDGDPLIEWVDMMHVGFWGEGHFGGNPSPFPDAVTAQRTLNEMVRMQLATWKKTPLAMNTQPDISDTGNREAIEIAVRGGAWVRSDSIIVEEPIQIEELANRPPWLASILEDGYFRPYDVSKLAVDAAGVNELENYMLHVLDVKANYWSLWTESEHLVSYNDRFPRGLERLRTNLGYRLRPSWVWQRKRSGRSELVVAISNRGVAGVPGVLWLKIASPDGTLQLRGSLDPGYPHGGGLRLGSFLLPTGYAGKVQLSAEIEVRPGVLRPIAWACEQPGNADGSISIEVKRMDDPKWRKAV